MKKINSSFSSCGNSVSKEQLIEDLRKIGVTKGTHLAVTLSFKSIGHVVGGPEVFIDSLLDVVGSEGTIMMNTFTSQFNLCDISKKEIFDVNKTMPYTGLVPRTLMKRKDSIRSQHPTNSVVCLGKKAIFLTMDHDENSNPFLPYEKLAKINGKYLAIGIGNRLVGIRHEAQRKAGLFIVPVFQGTYFKNCLNEIKLFINLTVPCIKNLHILVPELERAGAIKRGKIGKANVIFGSAKILLNLMTRMLKQNPTLNLCDDINCYKCRELERRMNLYERIENPRLFQKNRIIRMILGWRNKLLIEKLNRKHANTPKFLDIFIKFFRIFNIFISKLLER